MSAAGKMIGIAIVGFLLGAGITYGLFGTSNEMVW